METKNQCHPGKSELVQAPPVEICAFNERIQKVVVNADDLIDKEEREDSEDKELDVTDVEQEEERESIRKEEEVHPDEVKEYSRI
jgi:hypothetical protein